MEREIIVYELTPRYLARLHNDGKIATTHIVINRKYPGGTNQIEVEFVYIDGKEYPILKRFI